jgi:ribosomal protein S18 acetylase RimI-like enzyme
MIIVKKLRQFTIEDEKSFGLNGFLTREIYEVSKEEKNHGINISLKLKKLEEPLIKEWPHIEKDIVWYNEIIRQELSFGAYDNSRLIGALIVEKREWNNSLWIANIAIAEEYRGRGIGSLLMDNLFRLARVKQVRIIGLETQSTNLPAIKFYRKNDFELDGIDLSLYTNSDVENKEVALYMKKKI